jgi:hypothetical protein
LGTSTRNKGQNGHTPLVPSWLDEKPTGKQASLPPLAEPTRFQGARTSFTRFVSNGGNSRGSLRQATSNYINHSLGGSGNATIRLGSARNSTVRLVSVLNSFATRGIAETAREYHLGNIIGKSAADVMLHIVDFVCPDGGTVDEGIARSSYIEVLCSLPDWENKQIETLTPSEFLAFTEIYMTNVIESRLVNDTCNKLFSLPNDTAAVENIQNQIKDYVKGAVLDAVSKLNVDIEKIKISQTKAIVDSVYKKAYDIMSELAKNHE